MNDPGEKKLKKYLDKYYKKKVFTGCSVGLYHYDNKKEINYCYVMGEDAKDNNSSAIDENSYFDLASLTKPLVTLLSLLSLIYEGKLQPECTLGTFFDSKYVPEDKKRIQISDLINHSSGLPSHRKYYYHLNKKDKQYNYKKIIQLILTEELEYNVGEKYIYSDLDYILLGRIIEKVSGTDLSTFWKERITEPLGLTNYFYTFSEEKQSCLPFVGTGICSWSGEELKGKVNDDNCRMAGRMLGHAGLFGTPQGVMKLCKFILNNYMNREKHPYIKSGVISSLLKNHRKKKHWGYGFDTITQDKPSCGEYFSSLTIGHLGYTGTSFWIDLRKANIVVLLTNRIIFGDDKKGIQTLRPKVHDILLSKMIQ